MYIRLLEFHVRLLFSLSLGSRRGGVKSNRRKQKETVWWAKQKEKETLASKRAEETAKIPCKYFVAGFCKHVSDQSDWTRPW